MTRSALLRTITVCALLTMIATVPAAAQAGRLRPALSPLFNAAASGRVPPTWQPRAPGIAGDSSSSNSAMRGAYVGGALVGILGAVTLSGVCDECSSGERFRSGVGGFLVGALIGGVLGGMIGSL